MKHLGPQARLGSVTDSRLKDATFEQMFEQAPEAIAILDEHARVVRVNREFTRLFGYQPAEAEGRTTSELIVPKERKAEADEFAKRAMTGDTFERETIRQHKNGMRIDVSLLITPIFAADGSAGFYAIYRDIGEKVKTEQALLAAYARLEAQAEGKSREVKELRARLDQLTKGA